MTTLSGTLTTNGTTAVTGSGTSFTTQITTIPAVLHLSGQQYTVESVTDDTNLVLTSPISVNSNPTNATHSGTDAQVSQWGSTKPHEFTFYYMAPANVYDFRVPLRLSAEGRAYSDIFVETANLRPVDSSVPVGTAADPYAEVHVAGPISGARKTIVATKANGTTMTTAESGCVVLQSTNNAIITLPATAAGLSYTFIWNGTGGQTFKISPNASDRISGSIRKLNGTLVQASNNGQGTDNKDLELDTGSSYGDRVTLVADGSTGWFIMDGVGSWAFEA